MKTCLCFGDLAIIYKVTAEQNISNSSVCSGRPLFSLKTILSPELQRVYVTPSGYHARIQKVLLEGVQFLKRFFNSTKINAHQCQIALKAGHHQPASETPNKCRFACWPLMAQH